MGGGVGGRAYDGGTVDFGVCERIQPQSGMLASVFLTWVWSGSGRSVWSSRVRR